MRIRLAARREQRVDGERQEPRPAHAHRCSSRHARARAHGDLQFRREREPAATRKLGLGLLPCFDELHARFEREVGIDDELEQHVDGEPGDEELQGVGHVQRELDVAFGVAAPYEQLVVPCLVKAESHLQRRAEPEASRHLGERGALGVGDARVLIEVASERILGGSERLVRAVLERVARPNVLVALAVGALVQRHGQLGGDEDVAERIRLDRDGQEGDGQLDTAAADDGDAFGERDG